MIDNNVLADKDLIYEPYHQVRGEGFSGALFMAHERKNPDKKYIVKAWRSHVAACEFMFYRLAVKLDLPVANVRFISPSRPKRFEYPACAVDFIPNAAVLQYEEYIAIDDCAILAYLSYILGDRDNLDFLKDADGNIYKIDHSDCFFIEDTADTWINPRNKTLSAMMYELHKPIPQLGNYAEIPVMTSPLKRIAAFELEDFSDEFAKLKKYCGVRFEAHFRHTIGELIRQCRELA